MSGFLAGGCRPILLTCCWYVLLDVCLLLGRPCAAISATVICWCAGWPLSCKIQETNEISVSVHECAERLRRCWTVKVGFEQKRRKCTILNVCNTTTWTNFFSISFLSFDKTHGYLTMENPVSIPDLCNVPCFSVAPRLSVDIGLHGGELRGVQLSQRPCSQFTLDVTINPATKGVWDFGPEQTRSRSLAFLG